MESSLKKVSKFEIFFRLALLFLRRCCIDMHIDRFFTDNLNECFGALAVAALGANHVVASVEVVDNKFCAVGLVGLFTVNEDDAARRIRSDLDVALRNLGAEVEVVAAIVTRPNVHALVHKFKTLVDDDERLAAGLDLSVLNWALAEGFSTEEHFAVRRFGNDVDRSGLAARRWIFFVGDNGRKEECHHQGKNIQLFHWRYSFLAERLINTTRI